MRLSRRNLLLTPVTFASGAASAEPAQPSVPADDEAAIRAVLAAQAEAWNRGDLDAFMAGYWRDEGLRFASGNSVRRGWQATLDGYRRRYASPAAMGRLHFTELEIEATGPDAALVFGRWSPIRAQGHPRGLFTLLMRRMADGWKITRDHTSAAE